MRKSVLFLCLIFSVSGLVTAQTVVQLQDALTAGQIRLVSARGNGGSSGTVVEGELRNTTRAEIRINIHFYKPILMVNSGAGQNMIAAGIYLSDGTYLSDGIQQFIILKPSASTKVKFLAFCVDFEKENPTSKESFQIGDLSDGLINILQRINEYVIANPDADYVTAAQMAVWMAQGITIQSMREKFKFTDADERLARQLLGR
jgi:hypothetical protein